MKTTKFLFILACSALLSWSCTTSDVADTSLKSNLENSTQKLNTALNAVISSEGFQVLNTPSVEETSSVMKVYSPKIDSTYNFILLSDIVGEYEFNKANNYKRWKQPITVFFSKIVDNATQMIVRMPEEKVKRPNLLFKYNAADTLLTNNYIFAVSKYDYKFNRYLGWEYNMASTINVKGVDAGALSIQSSVNKTAGYKFVSSFNFAEGFSISTSYTTDDTAVSVYSVKEGAKVLYEEKYTAVKSLTDKRHREREYALSIGNVTIVRKPGVNSIDSAKVFVDGVLQTAVKVELVDSINDGTDVSVTNKKRELKITFDDGTSKTISELLGTSKETIRSLFVSLRQSYFATSIVDKIAWDVYLTNKKK